MTLCVSYEDERALRRIIGGLRGARLDLGLSQAWLARDLPFRGRAISEWETGAIEPTLGHLFEWSCALNRRLVVLDQTGQVISSQIIQHPGESWNHFERRRLATPLRNRRQALGMSQEEVGKRVGVSRDSIQRWELVNVPPRPIAHVVWAHKLGYGLALAKVNKPVPLRMRVAPSLRESLR